MRKFLHVGCGQKTKERTTQEFAVGPWQEIRYDIDEGVSPDIVGSMTDMSVIEDEYCDAVYSSHNIEHLYAHEVPLALAEFLRVLKPKGIAVITCPDLQSVCELVAQDRLTEAAYDSPAGPIAPIDILYGLRTSMAQGNLYMAHRCGFTERVLAGTMRSSGFSNTVSLKRPAPFFDLWIVGSKDPIDEGELKKIARSHFPK